MDFSAVILTKDLTAGCSEGIGIVVVGYPFETIRVYILFYEVIAHLLVSFSCTLQTHFQ